MPFWKVTEAGTNADGSPSQEYCKYCYADGAFTQQCTMDEMIEHCAQFVAEFNQDAGTQFTREEAIAQMKASFPQLKRWRKAEMKHEILTLQGVRLIGFAKEIAFREAQEECPKMWGEFVEQQVMPVVRDGKAPNAQQQAVFTHGVGAYGLCTCDIPGHNCATCAEVNFAACSSQRFTYAIAGIYQGGEVPEGMRLFSIPSGRWLKVYFEGGMKAFQQQSAYFHHEWLPRQDYRLLPEACCMEWYEGTDIQSPDYQCGLLMPIE